MLAEPSRRDQLAIGVDFVTIFFGKCLGQQNAVGKGEEGNRHRCRRQRRDIPPSQCGDRQAGQAGRYLADQRHTMATEVKHEGGGNCHCADCQRTR